MTLLSGSAMRVLGYTPGLKDGIPSRVAQRSTVLQSASAGLPRRAGRAGGRAPEVSRSKGRLHCLSVRLFRACVLPAVLLVCE